MDHQSSFKVDAQLLHGLVVKSSGGGSIGVRKV
jgi:hypothetical protein